MYSTRTKHRIWYDVAGDSGEPVLLIMGFAMRGTAWGRNSPAIAERHQVAWFDHAGLGQSGPLKRSRLHMHHMVDDAIGVLDELGWGRAHIVGISMGGMIAQHLALNHPERTHSLTLAATHAGGRRAMLPSPEGIKYFVKANHSNADTRIEALSNLLFSSSFKREQPELAMKLILDDFDHEPPQATRLAQLHAISRHTTSKRLKELSDTPTLIVRPGRDLLISPRQSDRLHQLIPGSRLLRFEECGHGVSREMAAEFNAAVLDHFLNARSPQPRRH